MSDLVLYNYFRSSASYRVRIGLYWKNLDFKYVPVHLLKDGGEQHMPAFQAINPAGEVPTLVHAGRPLSQSLAIFQYLDQLFPDKPLFPQDAFLKAQVWQFCESINCIQPLQNLKVLQYLESDMKISKDQVKDWVQHWVISNLQTCEATLEKYSGQFCFGDQVTAADLFLMPQLFVVKRFEISLGSFPLIRKIEKNCEGLEAFKQAHPLVQPDTPAELKK